MNYCSTKNNRQTNKERDAALTEKLHENIGRDNIDNGKISIAQI
jgi:hypothetical protein